MTLEQAVRADETMLSLIEHVRAGISSANELKKKVVYERSSSLEVVRDWNLQVVHTATVNWMDIDPSDHRYLLSGANNGDIYMHDLLNYYGDCKYTAKVLYGIDRTHRNAHKSSLATIQWYPFDSGMFVSSGVDGILKLWDTNKMAVAHQREFAMNINHHEMSKVPSKNYIVAVATTGQSLVLLDLKSGSKCHELVGHSAGIQICHWSPRDEALVATGSYDGNIMLWDIRSSKACVSSLDQYSRKGKPTLFTSNPKAHNGFVNGLRFTENGFFLISCGKDCEIKVWDVISGERLLVNFGRTPNHSCRSVQMDVTSCAGGQDLVFVPSGNKVYVSEIMSGSRVRTLSCHFQFINCCIYEPWYQQLFSAGRDRTILCWSSNIHQIGDSSSKKKKVGSHSQSLRSDNWDD